jgi:hypothetical protein
MTARIHQHRRLIRLITGAFSNIFLYEGGGSFLVSEITNIYDPQASVCREDTDDKSDPKEEAGAQILIQKMTPEDADHQGYGHGDSRGADDAKLHPPLTILGAFDVHQAASSDIILCAVRQVLKSRFNAFGGTGLCAN